MSQPFYKELFNKLRDARNAVENDQIALLNQLSIAADAIELEYDIESELNTVLMGLLETATPHDYTGRRPPQRSYEQDIEGLELFAFTVESRRFNCRVYIKFTLTDGTLWLVSLHQDRPMKEAR
jgi:hypothetical protein